MSSAKAAKLVAEPSIDGFLDRLVTLVQPRGGHRAGLDAALLQALVPAGANGLAVDLGAGAGTVAFCLAARARGLEAVAIERDQGLVECARAALALPGNADFAGRVRVICADVTEVPALDEAGLNAGHADWAVMNPPFDTEGQSRASPDERRRAAHVAKPGTLDAWLHTAQVLLKRGGALGLIHRAAELAFILDALRHSFGDVHVTAIHPTAVKPASRVLVRARLGARAGLQLMPPLILHNPDGSWTPAADAVLRGQAELSL